MFFGQKKNNVIYFDYKNHMKQDPGSKLITKHSVTDASVHDSQQTIPLLAEKDKMRSRVEHIFGFMEMSMKGMYLHNIGRSNPLRHMVEVKNGSKMY